MMQSAIHNGPPQGLGPPYPGGLRAYLERGVRPAVGFAHPTDVLKERDLSHDQKREILCSWASDASAVPDAPSRRWLLGTLEPVHLEDVLEALRRLDRMTQGPPFASRPQTETASRSL